MVRCWLSFSFSIETGGIQCKDIVIICLQNFLNKTSKFMTLNIYLDAFRILCGSWNYSSSLHIQKRGSKWLFKRKTLFPIAPLFSSLKLMHENDVEWSTLFDSIIHATSANPFVNETPSDARLSRVLTPFQPLVILVKALWR